MSEVPPYSFCRWARLGTSRPKDRRDLKGSSGGGTSNGIYIVPIGASVPHASGWGGGQGGSEGRGGSSRSLGARANRSFRSFIYFEGLEVGNNFTKHNV